MKSGKIADGDLGGLLRQVMLMLRERGTRGGAYRRGREWQSVARGAIAVRVGPPPGEEWGVQPHPGRGRVAGRGREGALAGPEA